jgi:hypothetical protein
LRLWTELGLVLLLLYLNLCGMRDSEQVVHFMLAAMAAGDFYIICPDNDVTRDIDNRRILWAAEDIIRNRPALSRWHPDYKDEFATFLASEAPFRS